jgi:hypothetical protein
MTMHDRKGERSYICGEMADTVELSFAATIRCVDVKPLLARLAERSGTRASTAQHIWQRTYQSTAARGLSELHLQQDSASGQCTLRVELSSRLPLPPAPATSLHRNSMQARRVAMVPVSTGASHFAAAMGFELAHESIRRGQLFRVGCASVSVYELCRRRATVVDRLADTPGADEEWEAVCASHWLVEAVLHGAATDLPAMASEADALISTMPEITLEEPVKAVRGSTESR